MASEARSGRSVQRSRPTPAVYRRRRLVALLVLLLVVGGLAWAINTLFLTGNETAAADAGPAGRAQSGADEGGQPAGEAHAQAPDAAADAETPDAADAGSRSAPEDADEPGQVSACAVDALTVEASVDPSEPAVGKPVNFALAVRNEGQVPCLLDAGPGNLVVAVASGSDSVWSSAHCAGDGSEVLLDIDAEYAISVRWSGDRSSPGCPGGQPAAGAGTYRATAALAGAPLMTASPLVFTLS